MSIRINMRVKRTNMHTADMTIIERWWRIFAAGFGYALH